jgi:hypothetical protein
MPGVGAPTISSQPRRPSVVETLGLPTASLSVRLCVCVVSMRVSALVSARSYGETYLRVRGCFGVVRFRLGERSAFSRGLGAMN